MICLGLTGMLIVGSTSVQAAAPDQVSPMGGSFYSDSHLFTPDQNVFYSYSWNTPDTSSIDIRYDMDPGEHMIFSTEKYNYDKGKWEPIEVTIFDQPVGYRQFSIWTSDWGTFRMVASMTGSIGSIATEVVYYNGWDGKSTTAQPITQ